MSNASQPAAPWSRHLVTAAAIIGMLGLYQASAQDRTGNMPFANSVEQRLETLNQLKELNAQIKEQNALLRSGQLQVVVVEKKTKSP